MIRTQIRRYVAVFTVSLLVAPFGIFADGFRNPPESASALGRIGGKHADVDDPSAATINPANLAYMEDSAASLSVTIADSSGEFRSAGGGPREETDNSIGFLPSAFGVMPLGGGDYVLGIGLTVPFGRASKWDDTASFAATSPYFAELAVINLNPSIATRVGENMAVAGGVSLYYSEIEFKQRYPWAALTGVGTDPLGDARFEGDGQAVGFNFAWTWHVADGQVLALIYKSSFDVEYDGNFTVTDLPAAAAAAGASSRSSFSSEIKFPTIISLGYSIQVCDSVRLAFDVDWLEHSRNSEIPVDIGSNSLLLPSPVIPQDWNDNWAYGFGLEWDYTEDWDLRAGCIYLETPNPTSTFIPVALEQDVPVISIGAGYERDGHSFDISYAIGLYEARTVSDNVNPAVNGEYEIESQLLAVAYSRDL